MKSSVDILMEAYFRVKQVPISENMTKIEKNRFYGKHRAICRKTLDVYEQVYWNKDRALEEALKDLCHLDAEAKGGKNFDYVPLTLTKRVFTS